MDQGEDLIRAGQLFRWGVLPNNALTANFQLLLILGIFIVALLAVAASVKFRSPGRDLKPTEIIGLVLTIGAALTAYIQWKDARYEASIKEYYERLDLSNRRLERIYDNYATRKESGSIDVKSAPVGPRNGEVQASNTWHVVNTGERWKAMDQVGGAHPYEMWVFTELDNLEYMLIKYRLGFAGESLLVRALNAFASRCRDPVFRKIAAFWSGPGRAGYSEDTRLFVTRVCPAMD